MYVIVDIGGHQYKLEKDAEFNVNRLDAEEGKSIKIKDVLLFSDGKKVEVGMPHLKDIEVVCDVVRHLRDKKIISFKYKRRKGQKRTVGHRQDLTRLKVKDIKVK